MAQLAAQLICTQWVEGSIPFISSISLIVKRLYRTDSHTERLYVSTLGTIKRFFSEISRGNRMIRGKGQGSMNTPGAVVSLGLRYQRGQQLNKR